MTAHADRRRRTLPAPTGLPDAGALPSRPRVAVVGGGIAGLAAATGLAERGVAVEVIEREPYLGGRVGGWTERDGSVDLAMNRGFHAFFRQYYNLRALLARIDPRLRMLTPVEDYPLIDGAGRRDSFRGLPRTPPWNAVAFAARSPTFRLRDFTRIDARAAAPLAAVSVPGTYERLDHIDAAAFLENIRFPEAARHLAFEVFSRSFFADPAKLSAAELATMFHIYFLGSAEGLIFDVPCANYDSALWQPMCGYLEGRGVRFRLGTAALGIEGIRRGAFACTPIPTSRSTSTRWCWPPTSRACSGSWRDRVALAPMTGGPGSRGCAPRRRSPCIGSGSIAPSRRGARRFWARPGTSRWTTSARWNATNAKPARGRARIRVRWSNCIPTHWIRRRRAPPRSAGCTRCTRKRRRHRSFTRGCCTAATARFSRPAPIRTAPR